MPYAVELYYCFLSLECLALVCAVFKQSGDPILCECLFFFFTLARLISLSDLTRCENRGASECFLFLLLLLSFFSFLFPHIPETLKACRVTFHAIKCKITIGRPIWFSHRRPIRRGLTMLDLALEPPTPPPADEELIRWGWPEDVWFHVDKVSSAHVYLRLKPVSSPPIWKWAWIMLGAFAG